MSITIEICVASIDGAIAAQEGGAHRIELNSGLALGGVTPSVGLASMVAQDLDIPVVSMLRPRESGFCYSDREFQLMRRDLDALLDAGVEGVAFGVLKANGTVDATRCERLLSQFGSQEPVFHRAFDVVPDGEAALETLKSLGVRRVMTSGLAATAIEGAATIRSLRGTAGSEIEILVAGGVRSHNIGELAEVTGCTQFHAALLTDATDPSMQSDDVSFSAQRSGTEHLYRTTDVEQVRAMIAATASL